MAVLYDGTIFACRHCQRLVDASQRETDCDRAVRRDNKIRERLGWPVSVLNPQWRQEPKGIRWKSFWLHAEQAASQQKLWLG